MKKLLKSDICRSVNSAQMHYSLLKSQHLWLLFMNNSRKPPETRAKKKKMVKRGRERGSKPPLNVN